MRRPLILHVRLVTGTGGGPDKTVLNSPRFLSRLGYDCQCAYLHPPDDEGFKVIIERARQCEAPLIPVPDRGPCDWKVIYQLVKLCRDQQVSVWHAHEYKSNVLGLLVRRFWPMKLVTTVHGWGVHSGRAPLYNKIDRRCLRFYDKVICVSKNIQKECYQYGVAPHRCHLIHNAIDLEQFYRTLPTGEAKARLAAPKTGLLIGAMGRLSPEKRFDLLVKAVASLACQGLDIHLWIAGEGPERSKIEAEVEKHALHHRVKLLGLVADPRLFLQAVDIFVLSSEREGLPNVVLEAMAMETPVIATRIAGVPGLLSDGQCGALVDPGSAECLSKEIERMADSANERTRLAVAARQRVEQDYSFERRMQRVANLYDHVLKRVPDSPVCSQRKTA
jgi:glycosyltransferase involved in cell wall biosynthesis